MFRREGKYATFHVKREEGVRINICVCLCMPKVTLKEYTEMLAMVP